MKEIRALKQSGKQVEAPALGFGGARLTVSKCRMGTA
jgi:hypothetical protein